MKPLRILIPIVTRHEPSAVTAFNAVDAPTAARNELFRAGFRPVGEEDKPTTNGFFLELGSTDYDIKMRRFRYSAAWLDEKCRKSGCNMPTAGTITYRYDGYTDRGNYTPPVSIEEYVF